jgi:hypothetical protein
MERLTISRLFWQFYKDERVVERFILSRAREVLGCCRKKIARAIFFSASRRNKLDMV